MRRFTSPLTAIPNRVLRSHQRESNKQSLWHLFLATREPTNCTDTAGPLAGACFFHSRHQLEALHRPAWTFKRIVSAHPTFRFAVLVKCRTNPTFLQQLEPVTRDVNNCPDTAGLVAAFDNSCPSVNYSYTHGSFYNLTHGVKLVCSQEEILANCGFSVASSNSTARASNASTSLKSTMKKYTPLCDRFLQN